jgi:hypothetical protein
LVVVVILSLAEILLQQFLPLATFLEVVLVVSLRVLPLSRFLKTSLCISKVLGDSSST